MNNSIQIKEVNNSVSWNKFLLQINPNTFLQSWQWGQVQKADGENVRYLAFYENNIQIAAALLITINAKRGRFLFCPHGPIASSKTKVQEVLPPFVEYCRKIASSEKAVALRISPLLVKSNASDKLFDQLHFRSAPLHMHTELTWMLDIDKPEEELLSGMRKTTRHAIRKAKKEGVTVHILADTDSVNNFWPLYQKTKTRHQFIPFSKKFISSQLHAFENNNNIYTTLAKYKNENVAAGIFVQFGSTVFYHHGASTHLPSNVPAAQLLQWESILEAKKRGATNYNFWGIAPENQPDHPFAGVTVFKKGFGGYAIDYMHAQDLPLSTKYWKLWAVDTYRKIKRGF